MSYFIWGSIGILLTFAIFYLIQVWRKDATSVDPLWAVSILFLSFLLFFDTGSPSAALPLLVMILLWSGRLTLLLVPRLFEGKEDSRYRKLREGWGKSAPVKFALLYFFNAGLSIFLAWCFGIAMQQKLDSFFAILGLLIFLTGWSGVLVADYQLSQFKKKNSQSKKVMKEGLWRYSRHPNYFFECVFWCALPVYAIGVSGWLWTVLGAGILIFLIVKITGIPPAEESSLNSRGEAYREYQKETSIFIPLPPKQETK